MEIGDRVRITYNTGAGTGLIINDVLENGDDFLVMRDRSCDLYPGKEMSYRYKHLEVIEPVEIKSKNTYRVMSRDGLSYSNASVDVIEAMVDLGYIEWGSSTPKHGGKFTHTYRPVGWKESLNIKVRARN